MVSKKHYNYVIVGDEDFPPEVSAMLNAAAEEAERGYSPEFLAKCRSGRPLEIGATPARHKIQIRLDDARLIRLDDYAHRHDMSRSEAVRTLLDKALADGSSQDSDDEPSGDSSDE